jgi:hypothetical protein
MGIFAHLPACTQREMGVNSHFIRVARPRAWNDK